MNATKSERRAALLRRLNRALSNVYHNATIPFHDWQDECPHLPADDWMQWHASGAMEYLREYHAVTGAGAACIYYTGAGTCRASRIMVEPDPMPGLTGWGTIYQYGRGGRTVAPYGWINKRGVSWGIRDAEDLTGGLNAARIAELIRCVEGFNAHVEAECADFPRAYAEAVAAATADADDHLELQPLD
jgi:hypothetical protein